MKKTILLRIAFFYSAICLLLVFLVFLDKQNPVHTFIWNPKEVICIDDRQETTVLKENLNKYVKLNEYLIAREDERNIESLSLLNEIIKRDYPAFNAQGIDDVKKVEILRSWAHENIVFGSFENRSFYQQDVYGMYNLFLSKTVCVLCGGAAFFLRGLYEAFGYEAYTIDNGSSNDAMTHVVTLVKIKVGRKTILSLQDATYDLSYTNMDGSPIDYFDLLKKLVGHNDGSIKTVSGVGKEPYWLLSPQDTKKLLRETPQITKNLIRLPDGNFKVKKHILTKSDFENLRPPEKKYFWEASGYPHKAIYIFLFPIDKHFGEGKMLEIFNKAFSITQKQVE